MQMILMPHVRPDTKIEVYDVTGPGTPTVCFGVAGDHVTVFLPDAAKLAELRDAITAYLDAGANTPVAAGAVEG